MKINKGILHNHTKRLGVYGVLATAVVIVSVATNAVAAGHFNIVESFSHTWHAVIDLVAHSVSAEVIFVVIMRALGTVE